MDTKTEIIDRLTELEAEGNLLIDKMQLLKSLYHQGYRLVDENDEPAHDADNVVNIEAYRE